MTSNAPDRPDSENRDPPAFDAAQKRAAAADIARRIAAMKRPQDPPRAEPGELPPRRAAPTHPAPAPPAPEFQALESQALEFPVTEPGMSQPAAAQVERPAHPMLRATALSQSARRRIVDVPDIVEPYLGRARDDRAPHPQLHVEPHAAARAESGDDLSPRRVEPDFSLIPIDGGVPDDPRDAWLNDPPAPRRRRFRPLRFAAIAATLGTAAGALMLWQFGLGENARQIVLATANQIAPGDSAKSPAPASPAATVDAQPTAAPAPELASAPQPEAAPGPAPTVAPEIAATPAPSAAPKLASAPEPAEPPAAAPETSPEPAPAFVAQPFDPHVLTPPADALPAMPSAAPIAAAPVSIPPTPTDASAVPQSFSTGKPFSTTTPPSSTAPAPRVVAQLKPAATPAAAQPGAKPFVPSTKAGKPKPVSKPVAKPFKPAPGPLDRVLDFLAPLTQQSGSGGKPQGSVGNKK